MFKKEVTSQLIRLSQKTRGAIGLLVAMALLGMVNPANAQPHVTEAGDSVVAKQAEVTSQLDDICQEISQRLASVSYNECRNIPYRAPRYFSVQKRPIIEAHYAANDTVQDPARILVLGGIHGDEYSSISVTFKWLNTLNIYHSGAYDWLFLPLANPDGLFAQPATRVNSRGVDLNRNFMSPANDEAPLVHWRDHGKKRLRYYPGESPLSEPESLMVHRLIAEYKPTAIVSVHAPHGIVDFDGDTPPPNSLGALQLKRLGTYPGSLGNYSWNMRGIPVVTVELASAGSMPGPGQVSQMWVDLVRWVRTQVAPNVSLYKAHQTTKSQPSEPSESPKAAVQTATDNTAPAAQPEPNTETTEEPK